MRLHQHIDIKGNVFGKPHPVRSDHKKIETKEAHKLTIEKMKGKKNGEN